MSTQENLVRKIISNRVVYESSQLPLVRIRSKRDLEEYQYKGRFLNIKSTELNFGLKRKIYVDNQNQQTNQQSKRQQDLEAAYTEPQFVLQDLEEDQVKLTMHICLKTL